MRLITQKNVPGSHLLTANRERLDVPIQATTSLLSLYDMPLQELNASSWLLVVSYS